MSGYEGAFIAKKRESAAMYVNDLAKRSGVPAHVVRYYTQIGLLAPERDPQNRYRDFRESDVYRVKFIRRAKWLGFTLGDVRAIFKDADAGISPCPEVREIVRRRARDNDQRLKEMLSLQRRVAEAVALWDTLPDQSPTNDSLCHLIDIVATTEGDLT